MNGTQAGTRSPASYTGVWGSYTNTKIIDSGSPGTANFPPLKLEFDRHRRNQYAELYEPLGARNGVSTNTAELCDMAVRYGRLAPEPARRFVCHRGVTSDLDER
ncbi:hypothetical protein CBL_02538 [Carabus blaptoides fortunei]